MRLIAAFLFIFNLVACSSAPTSIVIDNSEAIKRAQAALELESSIVNEISDRSIRFVKQELSVAGMAKFDQPVEAEVFYETVQHDPESFTVIDKFGLKQDVHTIKPDQYRVLISLSLAENVTTLTSAMDRFKISHLRADQVESGAYVIVLGTYSNSADAIRRKVFLSRILAHDIAEIHSTQYASDLTLRVDSDLEETN